jgi:organic hydroperoxide reductase OsmC/OhrA
MGSMAKEHRYTLSVRWTGNLGRGTENYRAYSRSHEITGQHKTRVIDGSSDPEFRGDPSRYNPEELLVGALSSCHMLWFLHLCSDVGIVVTEYVDAPEGRMLEQEDGGGEVTEVVLRPRVKITDESRAGELEALHRRAHELCFIARSVKFPVRVAPEQWEATGASQ